MKKKIPVGIDNFEKLRQENFYYVDKTGLIGGLLNNEGKDKERKKADVGAPLFFPLWRRRGS